MSENSSQDERISSMALQRKAYDDFLKWKSAPDRRALLVTGARQVGKTYLIREFGRNEYEVFLEINFIETPKAREIFEGDLDADQLLLGVGFLNVLEVGFCFVRHGLYPPCVLFSVGLFPSLGLYITVTART